MIRIVIGGDVCPSGRMERSFVQGNVNEIFHDLAQDLCSSDLTIVNLECPLISRPTPIAKVGKILGASADCVRGFRAAKCDALNLANNHIFDHGSIGLAQTRSAIAQAGLDSVGAGNCLRDAMEPLVREIRGSRLTVYSMTEREYAVADDRTAGANPLDLINFVNAVKLYKLDGLFIVLVHGGLEFYRLPSPEMVRRCRFMIDAGADAVICCHSHCALPWEWYRKRPIVYGLGNLIFEGTKGVADSWYSGYLARLSFDGKDCSFEPIPYFQAIDGGGARKMDEARRDRFLAEIEEGGRILGDNVSLHDRWSEVCYQKRDEYLEQLFGYGLLRRRTRKVWGGSRYSRVRLLNALLMVECETHREVLSTIFLNERMKP